MAVVPKLVDASFELDDGRALITNNKVRLHMTGYLSRWQPVIVI